MRSNDSWRGIVVKRYVTLGLVLALNLVAVSAAMASPADSVVGAWLFDEGKGPIAPDSSGFWHDGTINNPEWAEGRYGSALNFVPGGRTYVEIVPTAAFAMTDELTITAWVYLNEMAAGNEVCLTWPANNCQLFNSRIIQSGTYDPVNLLWGIEDNHFRLLIEFGNFIFQAGPGVSPPSIQVPMAEVLKPGEWIHIAGVYTGRALQLYVNGELIASQASAGKLIFPNNSRIFIGTKSPQAPAGDGWNGRIDEVAIFNKGLSAEEIRQVMDGLYKLLDESHIS